MHYQQSSIIRFYVKACNVRTYVNDVSVDALPSLMQISAWTKISSGWN